ncbi:MAG TPA: S41 family peptidase [Gaiellaceae bacterium]|nr:S41 family peptidase [Gaiellaceae bacterium]
MRRRWTGIGGIVLLLAGAFLAGLFHDTTSNTDARPGPVAPRARTPAVLDEVRHELSTGYYRSVGSEVLAHRSVAAMVEALDDPYTEYLTPEEYGSLQNATDRSYSGVGLTVGPSDDGLVVTSALRGPARDAGIRRGDVIVSIDGVPADRVAFERSLFLIKGEEGTNVRLTVKRPAVGKLHFTVVRQELPVPAVRTRLLRSKGTQLGYVRLLSFPKSTTGDLRRRTARLVRRGATGIVLDLRDNPGGLLLEAVQSVSLFLDEGVVCTTEGEHQERRVFKVSGATPFPDVPLVVLVNHGSASASEIVAAGLGENGRAVVVGTRTYGKAAVQSLRELSNGAALKLTTATYTTPTGRNLHRHGVRPRLRAVDDPATRVDEALRAAQRTLLKQLPS